MWLESPLQLQGLGGGGGSGKPLHEGLKPTGDTQTPPAPALYTYRICHPPTPSAGTLRNQGHLRDLASPEPKSRRCGLEPTGLGRLWSEAGLALALRWPLCWPLIKGELTPPRHFLGEALGI